MTHPFPESLRGRFQPIAELSAGGQVRACWVARELGLSAEVVIKQSEEPSAQALLHEYEVLRQLLHPNLVQQRELLRVGAELYSVQTFACGKDFASWAAEDRSPPRIVAAAGAVLRALQYLHRRGVAHGDVTPPNIRVAQSQIGRLPAARLIDLGLARVVGPSASGAAECDGRVAGTLGYIAPEVLDGATATPQSDLFGFGVVLLHGLTGFVPTTQSRLDDVRAAAAAVPHPVLAELLRDLLADDPAQRPGHAQLFEGLSSVAKISLQLSIDELCGDYLPRLPCFGREALRTRFISQLAVAQSGAGLRLSLTGWGKTRFARVCVEAARARGFEVLEVGSEAALLAAVGQREVEVSATLLGTRVVDRLLTLAEQAPLLLALGLAEAPGPVLECVLAQLGRELEQRRLPLVVLCDGPQSDGQAASWLVLHLPEPSPEVVREAIATLLYHLDSIDWIEEVYPLTGGDLEAVVELVHAQIRAGLPAGLIRAPSLELNELSATPVDAQALALAPALRVLFGAPGAQVPLPALAALTQGAAALEPLLRRGYLDLGPRGASLTRGGKRLLAQGARDGEPGTKAPSTAALGALHLAAAEALVAIEPPDAQAIAFHLQAGGEPVAAAGWLARSPWASDAQLTQLAGALPQAEPARLALLERLARTAARRENDRPRALGFAAEVAQHDPARGALLEAELLLELGDARAVLDRLSATTVTQGPQAVLRARALALVGDYGAAGALAASALAEGGGTDLERAQLGNVLGLAEIYLGQVQAGRATLERAEAQAQRCQDRPVLARIQNSLGIALWQLGDLAAADARFSATHALYRELGDLRLAAASALNLGAIAYQQMLLSSALSHYRRAAALGHRGGLRSASAWAAAGLGNLLVFFGEAQLAERALDQAISDGSVEGGEALMHSVLLYRAEAKRLQSQLAAAERLVTRAHAHLAAGDRKEWSAGKLATVFLDGELALCAEKWDLARTRSAAALGAVPAGHPDRWRAHLLAGKLALLAPPGDAPRAIRELEQALASERPLGRGERHFELHGLLAQAHQIVGDEPAARRHAQACLTGIAVLRSEVPPQHRAAFDQRPDLVALENRVSSLVPAAQVQGLTITTRRLLQINRDLARALNHGVTPDELLGQILASAIELTGAQRGLILLEQSGGRLEVAQAATRVDGQATAVIEPELVPFSQSIARQAVSQGEPIVVTDAINDPRFRLGQSVAALKLHAVLGVPLRVQDQAGALYLDTSYGHSVFPQSTVELCQAFADQAGLVMESVRLLSETAAQKEQLFKAQQELTSANRLLSRKVVEQSEHLQQIAVRLSHHEAELVARFNAARLLGQSKPMRTLFTQIDRVALAPVPVFIHGESGTGKELVARAIHASGPSPNQPFVAINCGAIPPNLLESEFFGHARGAFTGAARDRPGVFEAAGSGTLLLDEIGDMEPQMQVKLLRVLQDGTFRRLGDERERTSQCRVLSASHRCLAQLMAEGKFREDLFYRLNVIELNVPPLRQRAEDIPLLVDHFLAQAQARLGRTLSIDGAAMRALIDYRWPGNVRQLENEIQRAAVLSAGGITLGELSAAISGRTPPPASSPQGLREALAHHERQLIRRALDETGGNVSRAAEKLGLHRVLLHRKLRLLGIARDDR